MTCNIILTRIMILLIIIIGLSQIFGCPDSCVCKWKGGKQTVECTDKNLNTIPSGMDHNTQVLDFSGNNLNRLHKNKFKILGLINLQKIFFPRCKIKYIDRDAFKGLSNLVEIDLSHNMMTSVPTDSFHDFPMLMRLILNDNPIGSIRATAFRRLPYLANLELSNCNIKSIDEGAFDGLHNLEWLRIDNNKLKYIKGSNVLPRTLKGVDLHHNPWQCDCNLLDLRAWIVAHINLPQVIEPTCETPLRLKNKDLKSLEFGDLACLPEVRPTTFYLEISEGQNISLLCKVSAIPEARVSWWYQGEILVNDSTIAPGIHLYYFIEEGTTEKTSELFIYNTNAEDNGTFVCVAENQAGKSHSNYTIRILLKEEIPIGLAVFPYETLVVLSAAVAIISMVGIICLVLCFIQCRRQKKKRKKDRSKVLVLQGQRHLDKTPGIREDHITRGSAMNVSSKVNGVCKGQELMVFPNGPGVLILPNTLAYTDSPSGHVISEKNPDIISNTGGKKESEVDKIWNGTLPRRDIFPKHLTADVHLSPGKFIDSDGYPIDYGLPKIKIPVSYPAVIPPLAFYRTLPHKPRKGVTARFPREAECIHYAPDVRYTADGYPSFHDPFMSSPAEYKSADAASQWPEATSEPAQTALSSQPDVREALSESPDEGYVGEATDSAVN